MTHAYRSEMPAVRVLAQIDSRKDHSIFGVPRKSQGLCEFQDGVRAFLTNGEHSQEDAAHRLIGTDGLLEVNCNAPHVRLLNAASGGWQVIEQTDDLHHWAAIGRGITDLLDALETGREPLLSARSALQSTEIIFAASVFSRRRGRVDLPLTVDDNTFLTMLEGGVFGTG